MAHWHYTPGCSRPPERFSVFGAHAYVSEAELAMRRAEWDRRQQEELLPPDPGNEKPLLLAGMQGLDLPNDTSTSEQSMDLHHGVSNCYDGGSGFSQATPDEFDVVAVVDAAMTKAARHEAPGVEAAKNGSSYLTVLTHPTNNVTKTWKADGSIAPFDDAKYFRLQTHKVSGLDELHALLTALERQPHACVIRGRYVGDDVAKARDGKEFKVGRVRKALDYFDDQPLHPVMIDVDGFEPLGYDPLTHPAEAVDEFVLTELPAEWAGASYHWQLSSSFGHPTKRADGLKAHLWFWLEEPLTSAQIKAYAKTVGLHADLALFNTVQAHFTAGPVFEAGISDPFPTRSGRVQGLVDDVVHLDMATDGKGQSASASGAPGADANQVDNDRQLDRAIARDRVTSDTIVELDSALAVIDLTKRPVWIRVGHALASLKGTPYEDDVRELWVKHSMRSPAYNEGDESRWDTINRVADITYLTVFALAQEKGWKNPRKATLETERERSSRIGREGEHQVPTQRVMTGSEMLEELVYIADGARVGFIAEPRFALPFGDFRHFTAASVEVVKGPRGAARKVPRATLWLESIDRKTVRTQTFAPGRARICQSPDDELALNLWVPRSAAVPENWRELAQPFFDHVAYLVPREAERARFLDWLAHIEQAPGVLPHTHYLLVTRQTGIGRNWLAYALARAFPGYTALGFDLAESLRSGFNGALSQRLLAVVDELHEGGPGGTSKPVAEKLKSLLTEATRRVNPKYGRQHVEFNCCRFLMFSNHEAALPLAENDRRVVVIENPAERQSADYYARLYRLLDDPGLGAALAHAFRQRDITRFNPGEVAPMSDAKARTIRAGRSELEQAVRDIAADWPAECITSGRLHAAVADTVGGRVASTQGVAVAAGLVKFARRVKVGGVAQHVWILRNARDWSQEEPAKVAAEVLRGEGIAGGEDFT